MNWGNVKLILLREVRDQLRDRRTLFMIFVLPIVLYPLLGLSFFQVAQFVREHATSTLVVGADRLPTAPALVEGERFASRWFTDARKARLLELHFEANDPGNSKSEKPTAQSRSNQPSPEQQIRDGVYDVLVYVPPDFGKRLLQYRERLASRALRHQQAAAHDQEEAMPEVPAPEVYFNSALEKSHLGYVRVLDVLDRWRDAVGRENLSAIGLPPVTARPFRVVDVDVADRSRRESAVWSKIFPFLLLIWALTGAFYPAIDICAGEKERGTLETLLTSPAARIEIVGGKLGTVMLFSMTTVVLNLISMGITGLFILSQFKNLGPPPLASIIWLLLALVPISALFSALCLALAAFARSTKEGQYYLMPLVLVAMPLVVLPMAPGVELSLGNSLIPITGVVLLLRTMLEGNLLQALPFVPPVILVTLVCCLLAVRWAVDQFNTETVLFRESERLDLGLWFKHLLRDREDTPSVSEAVFCGVLILMIWFFMSFALPQPQSFADFAELALVTQLVVIATPALIMAVMLTSNPKRTLLLNRPRWTTLPAAGALAIFVHPLSVALQATVMHLYPVDNQVAERLNDLLQGPHPLWQLLLVLAIAPAIAEELAFRGFVLSGFRHMGNKWRAIILSSVFFGMTHSIFQQSLVAILLGIVIGYIAVQTSSIFPCMLFHMLHNGLWVSTSVFSEYLTPKFFDRFPILSWFVSNSPTGGVHYPAPTLLLAAMGTAAIFYWFRRQPFAATPEEQLNEAIRHHSLPASAA